jgi:hypothetical protein
MWIGHLGNNLIQSFKEPRATPRGHTLGGAGPHPLPQSGLVHRRLRPAPTGAGTSGSYAAYRLELASKTALPSCSRSLPIGPAAIQNT